MKKRRRERKKPVKCQHNQWIECLKPESCAKCGWNPEVAQRRLEEIKEKLRINQ